MAATHNLPLLTEAFCNYSWSLRMHDAPVSWRSPGPAPSQQSGTCGRTAHSPHDIP